MGDSRAERVLGQLHHWLGSRSLPSDDGQLLQRFVHQGDEAAFAELVARHGPLVFGLCRRLLGNVQDAEDVFQATFLVLARKAATIRKPQSLPCWLHGVAYRLALKARAEAQRRRSHEQQAQPLGATADADLSWREVCGLLDEELQRLPEKQRLPLVLCHLEGLTQDEASRRLGWPRGTLKRRLEAGRERLRLYLTRRGVTLGAGLFAAALTDSASKGAVSAALRSATVRAGMQFVTTETAALAASPAALLAKGALQTMLTTKLKIVSVALLLLVCAGFGASQFVRPRFTPQATAQSSNDAPPTAKSTTSQDAKASSATSPAAPIAAAKSPKHILGLVLWIEADTGITKDADGRVEKWADQSGQANDFSQSDPKLRPVLQDKAANGLPAVRFDGVDDALQLARPINPSGGSVFIVNRWNKVKPYSFAVGYDSGSNGYLRMEDAMSLNTGGFYPLIYQNMVGVPKVGYLPADTVRLFHHVPWPLTRWAVYSVTENPPGPEKIKWLGMNERNNVPENRYSGEIAAVLVYDKPLTDLQRQSVELYLGQKYLHWPQMETLPLAQDAKAAAKLAAEPQSLGQPHAADLAKAKYGILANYETSAPLPPGRYRLHFQLATRHLDPGMALQIRIGDEVQEIAVNPKVANGAMADYAIDYRQPLPAPRPIGFQGQALKQPSTAPTEAIPKPQPTLVRFAWDHKGQAFAAAATQPAGPIGNATALKPDEVSKAASAVTVSGVYLESVYESRVCRGVGSLPTSSAGVSSAKRLDSTSKRLSPVKVTSLRPVKIRYRPGENGIAQVKLLNTADSPQKIRLRLAEVTELFDHRALGEKEVEVAAGKELAVEMPFTAGKTEYGRDLLLELVQDGKVVETASDAFGVAENVWRIVLGGLADGPAGNSADYSEESCVQQIAGFRDDYVNLWEKPFWAPDDWGDLTPRAGATWYSCQARRHENTEKIKLQVDASHKRGIDVVTYGKCMAGGIPGFEMARAKPQWFLTDDHGRTMGREAHVWDFDHWQEAGKYENYKSTWSYRWVDLRRLDALDWGIDQLIGSTKEFGWDGVRYDSGGFRAHWVDGIFDGIDSVNTRNMKRTKERLGKEYPGYLFGYNTNNCTMKGEDRAYPLTVAEMSHEMREMLAGDGLWMGESIKEFANGAVNYKTWSQYAHDEGRCIRAIWQAGGHFCYLYSKGKPAQNVYQVVIGAIIGAHPYGGEHVGLPGSENWGRFLTRWSGMVFDHRLRPLADAEKSVTIQGKLPLWWKDFVNERVLSPTRKQVIIHLLNPPMDDEIAKADDKFPQGIDGCFVTLQPPGGQKVTGAWFISPGAPNQAEPLKRNAKGGAVTVAVPSFDLWAMVVLEVEGQFAVPAEMPKMTEPLSEKEQAELQRKEVTPQEKIPYWGLRSPAPTLNVEIDGSSEAAARFGDVKPAELKPATTTMPTGLTVGGEAGLDVLMINGFHHQLYRVAEAVKSASPQARIAECTTRDLPKRYADVFKYDLIVLVDMGADSLTSDLQKQLADFVEAGGRLAVLGGPFSLGQGFFAGSTIEKVLPATFLAGRDVRQLPKPLALGREKGKPFDGAPALYYYHTVKSSDDATPVLWAGDKPIAVERKVGKGSAMLFVGSIQGEATKDAPTPFWEWRGWAKELGAIIVPKQ